MAASLNWGGLLWAALLYLGFLLELLVCSNSQVAPCTTVYHTIHDYTILDYMITYYIVILLYDIISQYTIL